MSVLNGIEVEELTGYVEGVHAQPSLADRDARVVAQWESTTRARVETEGAAPIHIGGEGEFNAMRTILAALAACDVEVVATHATLMGIELRDLRIEAAGYFNVASLLGVDSPTGPGYQWISYRVILDAPDATQEQIDRLRELCEESSPVGDTLGRKIPLTIEISRGDRELVVPASGGE